NDLPNDSLKRCTGNEVVTLKSAPSRSLKVLVYASVVGMFLVLLMGALVTKSGSAEGCGSSWPLCDGKLLPAMNIHSIIEYSHRAVSGIVGLLVLAMAVGMWRVYGHRRDMRILLIGA